MSKVDRRKLLKFLGVAPIFTACPIHITRSKSIKGGTIQLKYLKSSLNAFSFNKPLLDGSMDVFQLIDFCADEGFNGVDITAYYFKGYPTVPDDEYLYSVKRHAFEMGVSISGTGVRNDFTHSDPQKLSESIDLVKNWVIAAEKLGAPVIRVFAGNQTNTDPARTTQTIIDSLGECISFGKEHGVVIGLQNHYDFVKTADEVIKIIEAVDPKWCGLILDTGSYRTGDPYDEIAKTIKYAVNWQIKEKVFINGAQIDTDINRLYDIIKSSDYLGFLPIETLGDGNPAEKVRLLMRRMREVIPM